MAKKINPQDFSLAWDMEPEEAIRYLNEKGYTITRSWRDMMGAANNTSFTVAGVMKMNVLTLIKENLVGALELGTSKDQWKRDIRDIMKTNGYTSTPRIDPQTGQPGDVVLPGYRYENIYRTNVQSSLNASRLQTQIALKDKRPYLMLSFVQDKRQSPTCRTLQGQVEGKAIPIDDPFFVAGYPPYHFQCRTSAISVSPRMLESLGLEVIAGSGIDWQPDEGFRQSPIEGYKVDRSKYDPELLRRFDEFTKTAPKPAYTNDDINNARSIKDFDGVYKEYEDDPQLVPPGLTTEQAAALRYYTFRGNGLQNRYIRRGETSGEKAKNIESIIKITTEAVRLRSAKQDSDLWRGVDFPDAEKLDDFASAYEVGTEIRWNAFSSTSKNRNIINEFITEGGYHAIIKVQNAVGADMSDVTQFQDEQEVLINRQKRFRVLSVKRFDMSEYDESGIQIRIDVEQLPDD